MSTTVYDELRTRLCVGKHRKPLEESLELQNANTWIKNVLRTSHESDVLRSAFSFGSPPRP